MFDRFTEDARKLMVRARLEAQNLRHDCIGTEHLLLGALDLPDAVATVALSRLGVDATRLRGEVGRRVAPGREEVLVGQLPFTRAAKTVLEQALSESRDAGHKYIGTGHMLLGLIHAKKGDAAAVLGDLGVTLDEARTVVREIRAAQSESRERRDRVHLHPEVVRALRSAEEEVRARGADMVWPVDLLIALSAVDSQGFLESALHDLGTTSDAFRARLEELRDA